LYHVGYVTFGIKHRKKLKKYTRDNTLPGWNDVVVWRDFRSPYILEDIWVQYIQHVMSERFTRCSQSSVENRNRQNHDSVTTHIGGSIPFIAHAKWMVRLILMTSISSHWKLWANSRWIMNNSAKWSWTWDHR
jgi:hypothetical protein